jgi:HAD superfamily hydrolase (TIGR01484 family)
LEISFPRAIRPALFGGYLLVIFSVYGMFNKRMSLPIKLISTDFDGTLFSEFENPPVPLALQEVIRQLQEHGARWVINTGRDLSSLLESLGRARLRIKPDFLVIVEREIYVHRDSQFVESTEWNNACTEAHRQLFQRVQPDLPRLSAWVRQRFKATLYEDVYSPFCFIAEKVEDADAIYAYLSDYCKGMPELTVVRNDIYARFSHRDYNKGSALSEIARQLHVTAEETFAAGDHFNDLPMLSRNHARWLAAPANAIDAVKASIRRQNGYLSKFNSGLGVADSLEFCIKRATMLGFVDILQKPKILPNGFPGDDAPTPR